MIGFADLRNMKAVGMFNEKRRPRTGVAVVLILILLGIIAFVLLKAFTPAHVPVDEGAERNSSLAD
jgi:hypothetical protein